MSEPFGTPAGTSLGGVAHPGLVLDRRDRPVRNGRWYLVSAGGVIPVGWGDLAFSDLQRIASALGRTEIFISVPESEWTRETWPQVIFTAADVDHLVEAATYAALDGEPHMVDHLGAANRRGAVWVRPGQRLASSGRVIPTARRRVRAIGPNALRRRIVALTG